MRGLIYLKKAFFLISFLCLIVPGLLYAFEGQPYVEGEILVRFKRQALQEERRLFSTMNVDAVRYYPLNDLYLVKTKDSVSVKEAIKRLKGFGDVEYAEPNYRRYIISVVPNDPLFSSQWAHQKIHSTEAWAVEKGETSTVIAVADTGIDYTHEDLRDNLWRNPGEDWISGNPGNNGIDDDGDGYIDNYYGINAITGSGDPLDDEGHGTHVSGIAGAKGNNLKGVSGINWHVSIMALKFIGADGSGSVADEIEAIEFARNRGVKVFNMSYGGPFSSTFERDAIANAGEILFIAAAGNEGLNNDVTPSYPANYDLTNIISVAASDQSDNLAFFSNYGSNTVSVSAPGVSILSTFPGNSYGTLSGTSMATPYVSGLVALVLSKSPGLSVSKLKDRIMRTADVTPDLEGKTLTGGRINAYRALTESVTGPYIYKLSPDTGSVGSQLTVRGSNFKDTAGTVLFGGVEATIISWSNEKIICEVPDGAITGNVVVKTVEGTSNGVGFEITPYPTNTRIIFPYASTQDGQVSYIVFSNPLDQPVVINVKAVDSDRDATLKIITLNALEKSIWDLRKWIINDTLFVDCTSDGFFGAAIFSVSDDLQKVIAMPSLTGVPADSGGGPSR